MVNRETILKNKRKKECGGWWKERRIVHEDDSGTVGVKKEKQRIRKKKV